MKQKVINVAEDFSPSPIGRYRSDSDTSGEAFRVDHLVPALKSFDQVIVNMDGTDGYGSSFLEEAFGGLIRVEGFSEKQLKSKLHIISSRTSYKIRAWNYISESRAEMRMAVPIISPLPEDSPLKNVDHSCSPSHRSCTCLFWLDYYKLAKQ